MFDKNYRPLQHVIDSRYCDYLHLPFRFRQKVRSIQSYLMDIRKLSKNEYKLYLFDDAFCLYDPLKKDILWQLDYFSSLAILFARLEELKRLFSYEKGIIKIKNRVDYNDYSTLKKKYYDS